MAKIVVARNQQAEMERLHPKPAYSRVIAQDFILYALGPSFYYLITPQVGNKVWLLSVDVWLNAAVIDGFLKLWFQLKTGQTSKASQDDVVFGWESVIDVPQQVNKQIYHTGGSTHRRFEMMKFYEGKSRRFAVTTQLYGTSVDCWVSVAWQISEG